MSSSSTQTARPASWWKPAAPPACMRLLNLPNFITLCRNRSRFPFSWRCSSAATGLARRFYIFAAAALTDGLDGTLARWTNKRTSWGLPGPVRGQTPADQRAGNPGRRKCNPQFGC